jgi:antitoxin (DNA-binding transcriptional repressor) of toxin-antitoxin stability system
VRIAKLIPFDEKPRTRIFGSAKGDFTVPDDFNESDAEIEQLFCESNLFPATDKSDK